MSVILLADDDRAVRLVMSQALMRAGYTVRSVGTAHELWSLVEGGSGDLVITDVMMPDGNGLDLAGRIKEFRPELPIIIVSARSTLHTAVRANEKGAWEYFPKPFDIGDLIAGVNKCIDERNMRKSGAVSRLRKARISDGDELPKGAEETLIGHSGAMQAVFRSLARLTAVDLTFIIQGESGTGKELIARAAHDYGPRKHGPFVAINMAAIPRELIESELFGHEKGAFTGATARSEGRFAQARGGTLFLDEIGDMPIEAQTRLLRVLQNGEYTPVGGRTLFKTDARIVAATHQDLEALVSQGLFRQDLYYRLNVATIRIPPLRHRLEDISTLIVHFFKRAAERGLPMKSITPGAIEVLKSWHWPGNVRELENLARRLAALVSQTVIDANIVRAEIGFSVENSSRDGSLEALESCVSNWVTDHFQAYQADGQLPNSGLHERTLAMFERPLIVQCLHAVKGNQIKAAELLGINRNTLRKRIRDLDITLQRGKEKEEL